MDIEQIVEAIASKFCNLWGILKKSHLVNHCWLYLMIFCNVVHNIFISVHKRKYVVCWYASVHCSRLFVSFEPAKRLANASVHQLPAFCWPVAKKRLYAPILPLNSSGHPLSPRHKGRCPVPSLFRLVQQKVVTRQVLGRTTAVWGNLKMHPNTMNADRLPITGICTKVTCIVVPIP